MNKSEIDARNLFNVERNAKREAEADAMLDEISKIADKEDGLHIWTATKKDKAILRNVEVDEDGNIINA